VLGFSEGAALAASLLLASDQEEEKEPRLLDSFKVAILFNSVVPLVPAGCENLRGVMSLAEAVRGHADSYLDLLDPRTAAEARGQKHSLKMRRAATEEAEERERAAALPRVLCFSPEGDAKISIPTVHVIGEKDPFAESSRFVVRLCSGTGSSPDTAQVVLHTGGHELPRDGSVLDRCAELIETTILLGS
jgi:pimeloyl-ACP methyl ester carboxylesterase